MDNIVYLISAYVIFWLVVLSFVFYVLKKWSGGEKIQDSKVSDDEKGEKSQNSKDIS